MANGMAVPETCQEDECKFGGPKFDPPVYKQRYSVVVELAEKLQAKKVVDMGCAECKFLRLLRRKQFIEELVGVDIDSTLLQLSENIVQPLITDFLVLRPNPFVMRLMQGSIADPDRRLLNFDLLACIEVIEHLDPPVLEKVPESIFGVLRPKVSLVFVMPIIALSGQGKSLNFVDCLVWSLNFAWSIMDCWSLRRHYFKGGGTCPVISRNVWFKYHGCGYNMTRGKILDTGSPKPEVLDILQCPWCSKVCERYPYSVEFSGVGEPPAGMEHVGYCSQMAVFTRLDTPLSMPQDIKIDAETVGMPYKIIAECVHPHEEHSLSPKEKLCQEAEYYLNVLLRQKLEMEDVEDTDCPTGGDSCVVIKPPPLGPISESSNLASNFSNQNSKDCTCGTRSLHLFNADTLILVRLEELLRFPRITTLCTTVDEIRSALQLSKTVKLDITGQCAAFDRPEFGIESDSSSETEHNNQPVVYADDGTTCSTGQLDSLQMGTPFSLEPEECWD